MAHASLSTKGNPKSEIGNPQSLRVLIVEDSQDDTLLEIRELKKGGYSPVYERVETAAAMKKAIEEKQWDIILCDHKMSKFNAPAAIAMLKETNSDDTPLIIISGAIDEETAIECMRLGAHDYIMKNNLSRLCPVIARELEEAASRTRGKQAEQALREGEEKYRSIIENMQEPYFENDLEGNLTFVNDALCKYLGSPKEELIGKNINRENTDKEDAKKVYQAFNRIYRTGEPAKGIEETYIRKDGIKGFAELSVSLMRDAHGKPIGFCGVSHDITERKQAEEQLRQSEEKYRTFIETINDGYYEIDLTGKYTFVNDVICEHLRYSKEEVIGMTNRQYQTEANAKKSYRIFTEVLKTGNPVKACEMEVIRKDGTIQISEVSISLIRDTKGNPISFRGTSRDITERKHAEEERKQSFARMRKALGATVQAICMTVEMKDPYTSGHQQRVSDLARSIATEMGLSADQQDFIRTAAMIHDIGKISIPAEILSKSTKLTDLEFSLIKTHSRSGYDILKDIAFPWPVANVVLQHHERMDGSGYPQGFKGNDILLEARILAVADVIEAIASHRPYRPSLGIDFALEEISRNKGVLYDADAVDACLKLFREKGYTLVSKK